MVAAVTPETAGGILVQLGPTLDACRSVLTEAQHTRSWHKASPGSRQETVTDLDLTVEERIITAIRAMQPQASIYSEETGHDPAALIDDLCVVLDPIDGTDLLLGGQSGYSISIAILSTRRVIAGLLDFPARDQRFICTRGGGGELNGRRLRLDGRHRLTSARVAVSSTQHATSSLQPLWESLGVAALVPTPGFTAKLATILLGECDAALYLPFEPRRTYIWDYAAAALLLREAGGTLTTLQGKRLLEGLPLEHKAGWLAATNHLREPIQRAVETALTRLPPDDHRDD
jgi:myo-inositol-1(or 4)-monophosphatase